MSNTGKLEKKKNYSLTQGESVSQSMVACGSSSDQGICERGNLVNHCEQRGC